MGVVTLTSDWGTGGYYAAAVKAAILSAVPDTTIIDITHDIPVLDIRNAAFVLRNSYSQFPKGTIHIIAVNEIESLESPHVVLLADGHYFIGTDTGIFSLFLKDKPEKIVTLQIYHNSPFFTFPAKDRFANAAIRLLKGDPIDSLGAEISDIVRKIILQPSLDDNIIRAHVMYIDSYKNLFLDIDYELFQKTVGKKPFKLVIRRTSHSFKSLNKAYDEVTEGDICVLFSESGFLEIAIHHGTAASILGLHVGDPVTIEY